MEVERDVNEFLASLNAAGVEYLVLGAFALAFHGAPSCRGVCVASRASRRPMRG